MVRNIITIEPAVPLFYERMRKNMARKDSKGYNLRTGECQRKDGKYSYAFTDRFGKRHFIYSKRDKQCVFLQGLVGFDGQDRKGL